MIEISWCWLHSTNVAHSETIGLIIAGLLEPKLVTWWPQGPRFFSQARHTVFVFVPDILLSNILGTYDADAIICNNNIERSTYSSYSPTNFRWDGKPMVQAPLVLVPVNQDEMAKVPSSGARWEAPNKQLETCGIAVENHVIIVE